MPDAIRVLLVSAGVTFVVVLAAAGALGLLPRAGGGGRRVAAALTRAPWLDLPVAFLTWIPWVLAAVVAGWAGFLGALLGEAAALPVWIALHEAAHRDAVRGPRIVRVINRNFGRWRNHLALWVTLVALPLFWGIRLLQILAYPWLVWLLRFPRYRQSEWINVSRHKFEGLVGHDLIWCLYCDWMTGVYALGGEMLRNVESFWCPIRFDDAKKCENCRIDFPDIDRGWVPADGTMADVERVMEAKYPPGSSPAWFGHPARLTVEGRDPAADPPASAR